MGWVRRHWLALASAIPLVPLVVKGIRGLITIGGDADFIISRSENPGWVGTLINWVVDPPSITILPLMVSGLALIYWDLRRNQNARPKTSRVISATDELSDLKISLQETYAANGLLDNFRAAIQFLIESRDVRICMDYRGKFQSEKGWGEWTRVTLLSRDFLAKGEWVYKIIFSVQSDERKRFLVVESPNDLDGKKRTLPDGYYMQCVVIVFYEGEKVKKVYRRPFMITVPIFNIRAWPEIIQEIRLDFHGMDEPKA